MDIQTVMVKDHDGLYAEFSNVAVAVAKRVMIDVHRQAQSDTDLAALFEEFGQAEKIEQKQSGRSLDLAGGLGRDKSLELKLNAKEYFAALRIVGAFRAHKFRSKVFKKVQGGSTEIRA